MKVTTSTPPKDKIAVLTDVVTAIDSLHLLEAIYGFVSETGCRVVGIADSLSGEQRDAVWDINWKFQSQYPHIDIEIILLQQRGRPITEVFNDSDSAVIKRETMPQ